MIADVHRRSRQRLEARSALRACWPMCCRRRRVRGEANSSCCVRAVFSRPPHARADDRPPAPRCLRARIAEHADAPRGDRARDRAAPSPPARTSVSIVTPAAVSRRRSSVRHAGVTTKSRGAVDFSSNAYWLSTVTNACAFGASDLSRSCSQRGQRVVGHDDVRRDAAAAVDRASRVGVELRLRLLLRFRLERVGVRLDEASVGEQRALAMDAAPTRRVPLARRDLERVAAVEREDRLHESLAEARRADDQRAVVILQRAGDDLARRRRAAVGEHDDRRLRAELLVRRARHFVRRVARAHVDDRLAVLEEERAHRERLLDDAAAIVAQVEHDAVRAVGHELRRRRSRLPPPCSR